MTSPRGSQRHVSKEIRLRIFFDLIDRWEVNATRKCELGFTRKGMKKRHTYGMAKLGISQNRGQIFCWKKSSWLLCALSLSHLRVPSSVAIESHVLSGSLTYFWLISVFESGRNHCPFTQVLRRTFTIFLVQETGVCGNFWQPWHWLSR